MIQKFNTDKAPKAIGPYSQAVISGNLIFTSGQISINPHSNKFFNGTISEQSDLVINNLKSVLEDAGSSLDRVVKVTIYLTDMAKFAEVNEIYSKYFTQKPARSTVEVSALPKGALIEIDCIAEI